MRTEKRFILFFAAATAFCCVLCVFCSVLSLNRMRDNNNQAVIQLISNIRAHDNEITDVEIMQILNANANTLDTEKMLYSFGISKAETISRRSTGAIMIWRWIIIVKAIIPSFKTRFIKPP